MTWVFMGAGNMASSLIGGLLNSGESADSIVVVDPDDQACHRSTEAFGILAESSLESVIKEISENPAADPVGFVIAVKPHIVETACKSINDNLGAGLIHANYKSPPLIVSVAAGVRTARMADWLGQNTPVIRCMPNTPALLGVGATALFANAHCTDEHKNQGLRLLQAAGTTVWVHEESELDAVTAVSGSGAAYFFYLIEHMIEAGVAMGLEPDTARNLAIDTAFGAASMARRREQTPQTLRENVTSAGGTTAAALNVFNKQNTPDIIHSAMQAAHDRAVELGNEM